VAKYVKLRNTHRHGLDKTTGTIEQLSRCRISQNVYENQSEGNSN